MAWMRRHQGATHDFALFAMAAYLLLSMLCNIGASRPDHGDWPFGTLALCTPDGAKTASPSPDLHGCECMAACHGALAALAMIFALVLMPRPLPATQIPMAFPRRAALVGHDHRGRAPPTLIR